MHMGEFYDAPPPPSHSPQRTSVWQSVGAVRNVGAGTRPCLFLWGGMQDAELGNTLLRMVMGVQGETNTRAAANRLNFPNAKP